MKITNPIVFIDCETTGKDPQKDRIVEIAILKMFPNGNVESKVKLVNPGIPIPAEVTEIHGITDEIVATAPKFKQIAKAMYDFIKGCDIGGYNSNRFDIPLLTYEFERAGIYDALMGVKYLDIFQLFCHFHPRTLAAAYKKYCGKDLEGAHDADNDVRATKDVLYCMHEAHPELKDMTLDEIAVLGQRNIKADTLNKVYRNAAGELCFAFGKNVDKRLKDDVEYCNWMVFKGDFAHETKKIVCEEMGWQWPLENC